MKEYKYLQSLTTNLSQTQILLLTKLTREGHKTFFLAGTWRLLQIITSTFLPGGIVRNPVRKLMCSCGGQG